MRDGTVGRGDGCEPCQCAEQVSGVDGAERVEGLVSFPSSRSWRTEPPLSIKASIWSSVTVEFVDSEFGLRRRAMRAYTIVHKVVITLKQRLYNVMISPVAFGFL